MGTSVNAARRAFMLKSTAATPTKVSTDVITLSTEFTSMNSTASESLTTRDMVSPVGWSSKKRTDRS